MKFLRLRFFHWLAIILSVAAFLATHTSPVAAGAAPIITSFAPTTGPAGTVVLIQGSHFNGLKQVLFSGVQANSVTSVSSSKAKATVPDGATSGAIALTTGNGTGFSSLPFNVTGSGGGGGSDSQAPTVPGNFKAAAVSGSQIDLSWSASTDNVGVTGYDISRGGTKIATVVGTSYSNSTGLSPQTTYQYTITAHDLAGNNSGSASDSAKTLSASPPSSTKPYFKVFGGSIFTGGKFANSTVCSNDSQTTQGYTGLSYQGPNLSGPGSPSHTEDGGIMAYAKITANKRRGSEIDGAAFAVGNIALNPASQVDFYSGPRPNINYLTLAMPGGANSDGGMFEGTGSYFNCIPDYYSKPGTRLDWGSNTITDVGKNLKSTDPNLNISYTLDASDTAQPPINLSPSGETVRPGVHLALYVHGDVYIGKYIKYKTGYGLSNMPKFTLVVQGNIYIGPGVDQLDGVYVAQPDPSRVYLGDPTGQIWTCHDDNRSLPGNQSGNFFLNGACGNNNLVVNGSLIANQVFLDRTHGDLSSDNGSEASGDNNIAETINYLPEEVLGGPFFNPSSDSPGADPTQAIESIISLPPLY